MKENLCFSFDNRATMSKTCFVSLTELKLKEIEAIKNNRTKRHHQSDNKTSSVF